MDPKIPDAVIQLGALAMQYATVRRVTFLADGTTPESDTDHTVMIGLVACAVAARHDPRLDVGLVAQFALVHDLVEAYAGDTDTFGGLSKHATTEKEEREAAALQRIESELSGSLPWVADTIRAYESLATPEARFVKTIDKIMPKITRILNGRYGTLAADFDAHCAQQIATVKETYGHDQEVACTLYNVLSARASQYLHKQQDAPMGSEAS